MASATASADDTPRVIPLAATTEVPEELRELGPALTSALAELLEGDTTQSSLEKLGKKHRCDIEMSQCLDIIAESLRTKQLVYGEFGVLPNQQVKVKLYRFDSEKSGSSMDRRTFKLTAQTPEQLGKELARQAAPMLDRPVPVEPVAPPRSVGTPGRSIIEDVTAPPKPTPAPSDDKPRRKIATSTWAIIGGGAAASAVGVGFLLSANSLKGDVADAPRETLPDFRRLASLERAGRTRTQVGSVLLLAGGAALSVGVVRAILSREPARRAPERDLALVPISGGAALVFTARGLP